MELQALFLGLLALWAAFAAIMALAWLIDQRTGNAGWVDVAWTSGVTVTGIIGAVWLAPGAFDARQALVAALVLAWGARLAFHIASRSKAVSDDPRYAKLRELWGEDTARKMFQFLQLQALCSMPIVLAIVLAAANPAPLANVTTSTGLILFAAALLGVALSDRHLAQFKASSAPGTVCDVGLWAWSRHPNYFFEWLVWVAFALMALDFSGAWNVGYLAVLGPVCMYLLLRYGSGVPPLESHMLEKYGDAYRDYQSRTSVFFPLPPGERSTAVFTQPGKN